MNYTKKSKRIVEETWDYLEKNYKGSEITFSLLMYTVSKKCDSENCRKQSLKYLWENYEFYQEEDYEYYKQYYKECLGIKVI